MRKHPSNALGSKATTIGFAILALCLAACSTRSSKANNDEAPRYINNPENLKISDKNFPIWAIRDIHPNKAPVFYLFVDASSRFGFYSNNTVPQLIGNAYQELCFHIELTRHIGDGFPHYPPGTEGVCRSRSIAIEQLELARRLDHSGKLTKTDRDNIVKILAVHITAWSRHWKYNGEWVTGSDLSRLGYSGDDFEHLPKPTPDSVETANCLISWSIGQTEIRPNP